MEVYRIDPSRMISMSSQVTTLVNVNKIAKYQADKKDEVSGSVSQSLPRRLLGPVVEKKESVVVEDR